jgi:AraC-like DNA-binding protein
MVSPRCKKTVKDELEKFGLHYVFRDSGEVEIMEPISFEWREQLKISLRHSGFDLVDDEGTQLIEKIKKIIIETVYHPEGMPDIDFSDLLYRQLDHNYVNLASVFSEVQGISIDQFITNHKIARVKELMMYSQLTVSEIALNMNYDSVVQLSNQFRAMTGLSLSYFRLLKERKETPLKEYTSLSTEEAGLNETN